jgi:hypothetical protein
VIRQIADLHRDRKAVPPADGWSTTGGVHVMHTLEAIREERRYQILIEIGGVRILNIDYHISLSSLNSNYWMSTAWALSRT